MLCWICPECGRDCSPAVRECPYCRQSQATQGVLALVDRIQENLPLFEPESQQYLLFAPSTNESIIHGSSNGSEHTTQTTAVIEKAAPDPVTNAIDTLVRPLVESAKLIQAPVSITAIPNPSGSLPMDASLWTAQPAAPPQRLSRPAPFPLTLLNRPVNPEPIFRTQQKSEKSAGPLAPQTKIFSSSLAIPGKSKNGHRAQTLDLTPITAAVADPVLPRQFVNLVEQVVPVVPPPAMAPGIAPGKPKHVERVVEAVKLEPQPVHFTVSEVERGALRRCLVVHKVHTAGDSRREKPLPAVPATFVNEPSGALRFKTQRIVFPRIRPAQEPLDAAVEIANRAKAIEQALELDAQALLVEINTQLDAHESRIRAIVATFEAKPAHCLLPIPSQIVTAPAPADFNWKKAPRPVITASRPPFLKYGALIALAQKMPLAGPCLPIELEQFIEDYHTGPLHRKPRLGTPAWIASFVIATSLFLLAGTMIQRLAANHVAQPEGAARADDRARVAATTLTPALEPHPFAKFVEVTGVRIVADLNHRAQVQYIVVNHSSTQLTGLSIRVAVRSKNDASGGPPLFTVSAVVPSLGPHQSKEIRTDLDSDLNTSAIPDWEDLRTDVQVSAQN